ncbi:MAG: TRAP transporter small permease [Spirochaetia bacterium]|jgi:TRAP-type C4-dicarboxylate transport system permease small subunit|nr:TRAP transporter small permease [Spirochaetia bacterium]
MKNFYAKVDKATEIGSIAFISVALVITFFHIIGRYILKAPIFFSEELARYCFIWSCMLGAAMVNRNDEHTSVTFFVNLLPKNLELALYIVREALIMVLLITLIYYGVLLSYTMRTVLTSALEWSWAIIYMSLPVGSLLMVLSTCRLIARKITKYKGEAAR